MMKVESITQQVPTSSVEDPKCSDAHPHPILHFDVESDPDPNLTRF